MPDKLFDETKFLKEAHNLLREEQLNQALMDSLPYPAMLIRKDRRIIAINQAAKDIGVEVASYCWDTFGKRTSIPEEDRKYYEENNTIPPGKKVKCVFCKADVALASQKPINEKIAAGDVIFDTYWIPLNDEVYLHYAIVL